MGLSGNTEPKEEGEEDRKLDCEGLIREGLPGSPGLALVSLYPEVRLDPPPHLLLRGYSCLKCLEIF